MNNSSKRLIISLFSIFIISLLLIFPKFVSADNLNWTTKTDMLTGRHGLGTVLGPNGKIYAIGGCCSTTDDLDTVEEYDPAADTWTTKTPMPTKRAYPGVTIASNNKIYVVGGFNITSGYLDTVEEYDPAADNWTTKSGMPTKRYGLGVAATSDGKIYAVGGLLHGVKLTTVEVYDIATDTWVNATSMPTARLGLGLVKGNNDKIYAIGGADFSDAPTAVTEEYDPAADTWTTKAPMITARSYLAAVNTINGKVFTLGGRTTTFVSTVESYDFYTNTWSSETPMSFPRYLLAGVALGNKIYAMGGINSTSSTLKTVEEATITPSNLPPIVDAGGPYQVDEGDLVQVTATGTDPDNDPITFAWDLDNNGSFETPGQTVTFSAASLDGPSSYTVAVQVTDDGNLTATDQAIVNILNVAPNVGQITAPTAPVQVNTAITASASFTDPGVLDTHTASWNWGDGNITPGTVTESNGSGSVSDSHTYTTAGVYTITLTVTDKDNATATQTFQYVSVYNPTPQGLFVGNRIFSSPAGAYPQNPNLTGQVQFGVTSKYQDTTLIGKVSMNFKAANLEFDATSITVLVISNGQATLRGIGTINGSGNYNILVTGFDGAQDTIRFQIKDQSGTVVYDSQLGAVDTATPTASVTGQVIVH